MRAVLDSSVLIAAYISRAGTCAGLLEDILNDHEWVISNFILDELSRKLREKFGYPEDEVGEVREAVIAAAEFVTPQAIPAESCRDPNDLLILGTAVAGRADVIITSDKDLLELKAFDGVPIVRPGEFWRRLQSVSAPQGAEVQPAGPAASSD